MATNEDREIQAKLRGLKKDFDRNEELMRKAARGYQNLLAEKDVITTAIEDLKRERAEKRRQTNGH